MRNYIILNGISSNTISGLLISTLPSISKPKQRTQVEEIDGRDGDIVTKLGYSAYEKEFQIGLYGDFDIDEVIAYFNSEGTVVFSNEDDKYYNYQIVDQIDFEKLIKFKTASVKMHVQPFKYPLEETPVEITIQNVTASGETMSLNNTADAPIEIDLKGNTSQDGTPTPEAPVEIKTTTGGQEVDIVGKNKLPYTEDFTETKNGTTLTGNKGIYTIENTPSANFTSTIYNLKDTYTIQSGDYLHIMNNVASANVVFSLYFTDNSSPANPTINPVNRIYSLSSYVGKTINRISFYVQTVYTGEKVTLTPMIVNSSTASEYQVYQSQSYEINLGRNLFDKSTISSITNGTIENDIITSNAISSNYGGVSANISGLKLKAGTYYISIKVKRVSGTSGNKLTRITLTGVDSSLITMIDNPNITNEYQTYSCSITTNEDVTLTNIGIQLQPTNVDAVMSYTNIMVSKDSNTNYAPYKEPIELCKIGDYQDRIYKEAGKWYIERQIGKIVLNGSENNWVFDSNNKRFYRYFGQILNVGSTTTADLLCNYFKPANDINIVNSVTHWTSGLFFYCGDMFSSLEEVITWLGTNKPIVCVPLATPTTTEITDSELITQLEAINIARSYDPVTNISQNTANKPFILDAIAVQKGSDTGVVNNTGNIYSKPTLDIEGTGIAEIYLDGNQMFNVDLSTINECIIDTTNLEAYDPATSQLMNRQVTGDYSNFKLNTGNNTIKVSGNVSKVTISDYTRWL